MIEKGHLLYVLFAPFLLAGMVVKLCMGDYPVAFIIFIIIVIATAIVAVRVARKR